MAYWQFEPAAAEFAWLDDLPVVADDDPVIAWSLRAV